MSNVNIAQWLTTCQSLPPDAPVTITAGELLALVQLAGGSGASVADSADAGATALGSTPQTTGDMSSV